MENHKEVLESFALLIQKISRNQYTREGQKRTIEALNALSENPLAVSVDRKLLAQIWPESERYLGVDKKGYLLFIMNSTYWRKRKQVSSVLEDAGVLPERIRFIKGDADAFFIEKEVDDLNCRAILYLRDVPTKVKALMPEETSVVCRGVDEYNMKKAILSLRQKLL